MKLSSISTRNIKFCTDKMTEIYFVGNPEAVCTSTIELNKYLSLGIGAVLDCCIMVPGGYTGGNRYTTGIIPGIGSANERRRYIVTSSLIGWTHTQPDPWPEPLKLYLWQSHFNHMSVMMFQVTVTRLFVQQLVKTNNIAKINALAHYCRRSNIERWIPSRRPSNAEIIFMPSSVSCYLAIAIILKNGTVPRQ